MGIGLRQNLLATVAGVLLSLAVQWPAAAQSFTNSATLTAALDTTGTNLLITYSLTTTQGWVTLFYADRPEQLATSAQPVDLAQVLPSQQGQFTVPIDSSASAKFYRLLIEQWPSRGKALVFTNGPYNFAAMKATYGSITNSYASTNGTPVIFNQPAEVWTDNLGTYDTNGVLVGSNGGKLVGRFGQTGLYTIDEYVAGYQSWGGVAELYSSSNDFRVTFDGSGSAPEREAILWSSEAQFYYNINDYRNRFLNDSFIQELHLSPGIASNLAQHQFRPDLNMGSPPAQTVVTLQTLEYFGGAPSLQFFPIPNLFSVPARTRGPQAPYSAMAPLSLVYDATDTVGDYAGLVAFWLIGTNTGFPSDTAFPSQWQNNVLSAVNNGLSDWVAYVYSGNPEVYPVSYFAWRIYSGRPCGGTGIPCDKGVNIRNVMMFDEANVTADGVFPYSAPTGIINYDGPGGVDLACIYISAIFYDIANEAGLGVHKADLLFWQSISLITNNVTYPMRSFGATIQQAARALWPDPRAGRAGLSLYEEDINDVLTSRGIPLNGVADFRTNLPAAIGTSATLDVPSANGFGSAHPESQPGANSYGQFSGFLNGYTQTNASSSDYVAYQFYRYSRYGPCDELRLTDGTFNATTGAYNSNGTYYVVLTDRDLGNLDLLLPGNHVRWARMRYRCPNEATGFYAEDVRPFGFRVIKATPNGFSFTASAVSSNQVFKSYQLAIVDPSTNTLGSASYTWTFTDYQGNLQSTTGSTVQYAAYVDQPFTINIVRTRSSQTDTLTLRERGNDLDRNNGQAFVRNLVP